MSYSESDFEEDFKLVFAASKSAKKLTMLEMSSRIKSHAMVCENQAVLKITSFSNTNAGISKAINYNSRDNDLPLFDGMDDELKATNGEPIYKKFIDEVNTLNEGQHKTKRLTMNFILSLSDGSTKKEFEEGTRHFLAEHFGNQPYIYTFHDDTEHYHAHVIAGLREYDGKRVITSKEKLLEWRQGFSEAMTGQGVVIEATPALSRGKSSSKRDPEVTKKRILERGGELSGKSDGKKPGMTSANKSINKRHSAWNRMHKYMKENNIDGEKELKEFIDDKFQEKGLEI